MNKLIVELLRRLLYVSFMLGMCATDATAQGMYTDFGQSRIQYEKFEWQFYRNENFDAYFYTGGKELATFTMKVAEKHLKTIEKILDYRISDRIEFVIYNTTSDLKQSNIGMTEAQVNTGGVTRIYDTKVVLSFDGDHEHFSQQIKEGLAEVTVNEMLYGGSLTERLQNAALLTLPPWYVNGLMLYLSEGWTVADDSRMKDEMKSRRFKKFSTLTENQADFAGKSIWKYVIESNDERVVSNLLYITRITRNIESSFFYVLGVRMRDLSDGWEEYYTKLYERDDMGRSFPEQEIKLNSKIRSRMLSQVKLSPMGNKMLIATNHYGRYKVFAIDLYNGSKERVFKGGHKYRNMPADYSFPLVDWHPNGKIAGIFYERKGAAYFSSVNLENGRKERFKLQKLDKVTGFEYHQGGNTLLLTGTRKGQSDLYMLDVKSQRERQLTNDFFDDKDAHFINEGKQVVFASNRKSDSLNAWSDMDIKADNNYDIFIYDLEKEGEMLHRLTNTPYVNESSPMPYDKEYVSYLTDYNGIQNRYAARMEPIFDFVELRLLSKDTAIRQHDTLMLDTLLEPGGLISSRGKTYSIDSMVEKVDTIMHYRDLIYTYPLTNYSRNVIAYDVCLPGAFTVEMLHKNGSRRFYKTPSFKDIPEETKDIATLYTAYRNKKSYQIKAFKRGPAFISESLWPRDSVKTAGTVNKNTPAPHKADSIIPATFDSGKYYYLNEFTNRENFRIERIFTEAIVVPKNVKEQGPKMGPPRNYRSVFMADYFVTQLDNTVLNTYYQPYTPGAAPFFNPGFNGLFKLGIGDIFNDKRISGGFRLAVDLRGTDVFLAYENNKKRRDKRLQYFRQSRFVETDFDYQRSVVNELRLIQKYPFTERSQVRLHIFGRQDRTYILSSDIVNARRGGTERNWAGLKLEYVYDNTVNKGLNLFNGLRYKIFAETFKDVDTKKTTLAVVGIDIRNYMKIHRQIIFAQRFTANTSFGSARVVYFLGGVDNWLTPRFNSDILVATDKNFVYQALATNMRGFIQNIRNGNSFAVLNTEIRIPLFAYISNRPMRSDFLKNFMIVPFADVGTAWSGKNPAAEDNTFNKRVLNHYPLSVTIINIREPLVGGVGGGLHLKLFGYFVRGDVAWGIEDLEMKKDPVYYVSLSTDF